VLRLNRALGYDFNTVEFAVRDGVPYAIDFCNPAPDADVHSIGEDNFAWVVEAAADMAVRKALAHQAGQSSLTWGEYVIGSAGAAAGTGGAGGSGGAAATAGGTAQVPPPPPAAPQAAPPPPPTPPTSAVAPGPTPVGHLVGDPVGSTWHQGGTAGAAGDAAPASVGPDQERKFSGEEPKP
jgi:hypothetical protein